jgi:hypothetical protein
MLDLMQVAIPQGAAAVDTVRVLDVVATSAVHAGGPGLLGAGSPLAAGGAGNAVVAGATGFVGAGAPQAKLMGGELIAVLSALLVFRARAWRTSTDESRAKLFGSYADIPVSPA